MLIYKRRTCEQIVSFSPTLGCSCNSNKNNRFWTSKYKLGKQLLIEGVSIIIHPLCAQKEIKLARAINGFTPCRFNFFSTWFFCVSCICTWFFVIEKGQSTFVFIMMVCLMFKLRNFLLYLYDMIFIIITYIPIKLIDIQYYEKFFMLLIH